MQRLIAKPHLTEEVSVEELILEYVESVRRRPLTFNGQILDRITVCAHPSNYSPTPPEMFGGLRTNTCKSISTL